MLFRVSHNGGTHGAPATWHLVIGDLVIFDLLGDCPNKPTIDKYQIENLEPGCGAEPHVE
jgi:hypothetical protein